MNAVDEAITRITEAPTEDQARAIVHKLSRRLLLAVADQIYVETEGHGTDTIRRAVLKEARA